jgi:hypothetical protein
MATPGACLAGNDDSAEHAEAAVDSDYRLVLGRLLEQLCEVCFFYVCVVAWTSGMPSSVLLQRNEFQRPSAVAPAAAAVASNADFVEAKRPLDSEGDEPIVRDPPGNSDVQLSARSYLVVRDVQEGIE